jgi:hypothetical protein
MKNKLPSSVYNPMSLAGAALSAISFGLIIFLFLLELLGTKQKPYMGIIIFVILPFNWWIIFSGLWNLSSTAGKAR